MSDIKDEKKALIQEIGKKLEQLLRTDRLSEEGKTSVLRELLAIAAGEQDGGSNKCQA